ncbi:hypothetical protein ABKP09_15940 [Peribacillus frigoritolerans]|uniref:hypothetical protein n=1 Tax=Peribacillus frigoritolerans TaxID=450367 RepID=UPI0032B4F13A
MKDKLVFNMVRDETGQQFFLLKNKVDWNGRYETPAGKAWPRETPRADRPRKPSAWSGNQRSDLLTLKNVRNHIP